MKALILEDNANLANTLKQLLSKQGLDVHISPCWRTASSLIDTNPFKIIVLDILLPDKKGFEVLKILSEKNIKAKIAIMSGLFKEQTVLNNIPDNLKQNCRFFKKPIDETAFLSFINKGKDISNSKNKPFIESFFEKSLPFMPLNFYFSKSETFDSKELISIVFLAHLKQFTGKLEIHSDNSSIIQFYKGSIIKVVSNSQKSFFGELLVEHGLSLKEDVEVFLGKKDSHKRIGEQLVEKELLSPQMLSFILKEQIKIRLSECISQADFRLVVRESKKTDIEDKMEIDFNGLDFIEWLADSVQTELNAPFLDNLYREIQTSLICKSSQLNVASINQRKFLKKYNTLFKTLKEGVSIEELRKKLKSKHSLLRLLYFGLLTKSIYLEKGDKKYGADESLDLFLDNILSKQSHNLLQVFGFSENCSVEKIADFIRCNNLPKGVSMEEIDVKYNQLVCKIHPDSLPENISSSTKEKANRALSVITNFYNNLKNEDKRKEYLAEKNKDQFLTVFEQYEKGLENIKSENYKKAYEQFLSIKDHDQAPGNTRLYLLWARMKRTGLDIIKERSEAVEMQKIIDSSPISLRVSALFWYVKGLFCFKTIQYEKAKELFTKALLVQKDFAPAKKELITVKYKLKQKNKSSGKKSFLSLFKKSS